MTRKTAALYQPMVTGLAGRVLAFFDANPDEVLTTTDIATKFRAQVDSVPGCLRDAVKSGHLIRQYCEANGVRRHSLWARNPQRDELLKQTAAVHQHNVQAIQTVAKQAASQELPKLKLQAEDVTVATLVQGGARLTNKTGQLYLRRSDLQLVGRVLLTLSEAQA